MEHIQNIVSVQEFAEQMSKNVGIGSNKIYSLVKKPGFPSVKIGGRFYVLIDRVDEWMERQNFKKNDKNG